MTYRYALGSSTPLTGTNVIHIGGSAPSYLSGSGSAYLSQLVVGDFVLLAGTWMTITSISSDTRADYAEAVTLGGIGASITGNAYKLKALDVLKIPWPKHTFTPQAELVRLGDGQLRALGKPTATWEWSFLPLAPRGVLRTFCPGYSATVVISTRINDGDAFKPFIAIMDWPEEKDKQAGRRMNLSVAFSNLVLQEPAP